MTSFLCWEFFSSPPRLERFWGPPSLLSNGYQWLFPWGLSGRGVKLTTLLHLAPRSRMSEDIPPLPQYALGPPSLLSNEYGGFFLACKAARA